MNRFLQRFYAWLLPIGPMRLTPNWDRVPPYSATFLRGVPVTEPTADELRLAADLQAMFHRLGMHADGLRAVIIPPTDDPP